MINQRFIKTFTITIILLVTTISSVSSSYQITPVNQQSNNTNNSNNDSNVNNSVVIQSAQIRIHKETRNKISPFSTPNQRTTAVVEKVIRLKVLSKQHPFYGQSIYAIPAYFGQDIKEKFVVAGLVLNQTDMCKTINPEFPELNLADKLVLEDVISDSKLDLNKEIVETASTNNNQQANNGAVKASGSNSDSSNHHDTGIQKEEDDDEYMQDDTKKEVNEIFTKRSGRRLQKRQNESADLTVPWLAFLVRGSCPFDIKLYKAQQAGYNFAAIYNPPPKVGEPSSDIPIRMLPSTIKTTVDIPSIFITWGQIKNLIVNSFTNEPFLLLVEPLTWEEYRNQINSEIPFEKVVSNFLFCLSVMLLLASFLMSIGVIYGLIRNYMIYGRFIIDPELEPTSQPKLEKVEFPIKTFVEEDLAVESAPCCAICLDDFQVGCKARQLPCGHPFHVNCVDPWLMKHNRLCPTCKQDVLELFNQQQKQNEDPNKTFSQKFTEKLNLLISRLFGFHRYTAFRSGGGDGAGSQRQQNETEIGGQNNV